MTSPPKHGYWLVARNRIEILTSSADTRGLVVARAFGQLGDSAPLHRHHNPETFIVTAGRLRFWLDGVLSEAGPQQSITVPGDVAHTYHVLEPDAEWLLVSTGSSFDEFVAQAGTPVVDPSDLSESAGPPDPARLNAIGVRHGIEILGPPPIELRG
ncbi:MAG: cupin domain-containing protein [Actinomycetota bacterium]|nr:cupin domain-containing protein [Actinomycetota bacterium]